MADQEVTLQDFMYPEFRGKDPKDYEFRRGDGKIVRKDRWETGMFSIAYKITGSGRVDFEIDNLIKTVEWLMDQIPEREIPRPCVKCGGTGLVEKYFDAGDHFGGGSAPGSGYEEVPCPKCSTVERS